MLHFISISAFVGSGHIARKCNEGTQEVHGRDRILSAFLSQQLLNELQTNVFFDISHRLNQHLTDLSASTSYQMARKIMIAVRVKTIGWVRFAYEKMSNVAIDMDWKCLWIPSFHIWTYILERRKRINESFTWMHKYTLGYIALDWFGAVKIHCNSKSSSLIVQYRTRTYR